MKTIYEIMNSSENLLSTIKRGNYGDICSLLHCGLTEVDLEFQSPEWNGTALFHLVCLGYVDLVAKLLKLGARVDTVTKWNGTPLHASADYGYVECTKLLLEHGADPDVVNSSGETACHLAAYRGLLPVVRLLVERGANSCLKNRQGRTPALEAEAAGHMDVARFLVNQELSTVSHGRSLGRTFSDSGISNGLPAANQRKYAEARICHAHHTYSKPDVYRNVTHKNQVNDGANPLVPYFVSQMNNLSPRPSQAKIKPQGQPKKVVCRQLSADAYTPRGCYMLGNGCFDNRFVPSKHVTFQDDYDSAFVQYSLPVQESNAASNGCQGLTNRMDASGAEEAGARNVMFGDQQRAVIDLDDILLGPRVIVRQNAVTRRMPSENSDESNALLISDRVRPHVSLTRRQSPTRDYNIPQSTQDLILGPYVNTNNNTSMQDLNRVQSS